MGAGRGEQNKASNGEACIEFLLYDPFSPYDTVTVDS